MRKRRRGLRLSAALLFGLPLVSGCAAWFGTTEKEMQRYHNTRWECIAQVEAGWRDVGFPVYPQLPDQSFEPLSVIYGELLVETRERRYADEALIRASEENTAFCAQMVSALVERRVEDIEALAPQIAEHREAQQAAADRRAAFDSSAQQKLAALKAEWDRLWPGHSLSFELQPMLRQIYSEQQERQLDETQRETLRRELKRYYENEYRRLAQSYLGQQPEAEAPQPLPAPAGAEELAAAIGRLGAALAARQSLDRAIEADLALVQKFGKHEAGEIDWQTLSLPKDEYGRSRMESSMARLQLYKELGEILSSALEANVRELRLLWTTHWPEHNIEPDIFAFEEGTREEVPGDG